VFDVSLESDVGRLDEAVEKAVDLVEDLARRAPADTELDRAKSLIATRWARQFESMDGRAAVLCEAEALGDYQLADTLYRHALAVTSDGIQTAVATYLAPSRACGVAYLPDGASTRMALGGGWPLTPATSGFVHPPAVRAITDHMAATARSRDALTRHAGGITRLSLDGADLLVREKRGAGLVSVALTLPGVPGRETADTAGISRLFARSAMRGAGDMTGEELAQRAELLGGALAPIQSVDTLGWSITVRNEALQDAAALLRVVALESRMADEDVRVERDLQASDARRARDDMSAYPVQRVREMTFAQDAYGLPMLGDPETVEGMTAAAVAGWAARVRGTRAIVVAVGDLETEALLAGLEPLASWAVEDRGGDHAAPPPFAAVQGAEPRDKAQTALAMAFPARPYADRDRYAITVTSAILSGLAGRLFDELREKRSLAYTVAAFPWLRRRAGAMLAYIATSPKRENEAREAMLTELGRLGRDGVGAAELSRARNYAAGLAEIRRQSGAGVASEILSSWLYGVIDEFVLAPEQLRAVSADDVVRVASEVFVPESRSEFVVRGTGKSR
jgi:zinc protease